MFAIMAVLPDPMNESFNTCVSLLPLNGVWPESMSIARMHLNRARYCQKASCTTAGGPGVLFERKQRLVDLSPFQPCFFVVVVAAGHTIKAVHFTVT